MKKICFINGSLRGEKASSLIFINEINFLLGDKEYQKEFITVKLRVDQGYSTEILDKIRESDVIIIAFPLFSYCLPGGLMRLLEEYYLYIKNLGINENANKHVYAIVNSGYHNPKINDESICVIKNFCNRLNLIFRFAIQIGCGPVTIMTKFIDFKYKKAFKTLANDINNNGIEQTDNIYITPILPKILMDTIRLQLDKNALKKEQKRRIK
ncbi:MAG: hypothetical protein A2086_00655 [Spirochaetes bacterium GWD1_27_9]|nr:MAG: hypothetical protein A2Z98_05165 [Spirochaetes bacterium GWB1_27_13]OHD21720.1 MAG: hypothetical protein A2Y34_08455 [Spirochaetes bacterium GWC1_27_15]OHD32520.1 MAG: hypothetical protein A2086_00655 [Spirochaetes bacterium GWD1_27_9]